MKKRVTRTREPSQASLRDIPEVDFEHARREEVIQEMVALCWKWFVRLAERGRDATRFPSALATYAAKAVRSGRRWSLHFRRG